ncbi:MAG: PaaI family thioesterase [Pseudomonadota bacterium]|nr:PaaI family thioesterase [Pseudomonadota bacterium]
MSSPAAERTTTGLEYLQRILRGEIPSVPIGDTLGFRITEVEKGRVVLLGNPDRRSYNLIGTVHGGWAAAILDSALALSALSTLEADQGFTTVDIRINYLRPLSIETGEVRAEGRVLQGGRRLAYCEAKLTDAAGKLICHGTGSCLILPKS